MIYSCCSLKRKNAILENPAIKLNGIDYLEVSPASQQTLLVHCLLRAPSDLTSSNVMIVGGESITDIAVVNVSAIANTLRIVTDQAGDFSTYTLRLVNSITQAAGDPFEVTEVLTGFDPQLAEVDFSFKVECGPDFDCAPQIPSCSPAPPTPPPINYLAKDYGSFRTLILDRLNQLLPAWGGTSEADLGVALAELMAYKGDYLSYQQDAVATEAYIETARSRVSLRRHARLVDYYVHDGCNARTWIHLPIAADPGGAVFLDRALTRFYTYAPGMPSSLAVGAGNEEAALSSGVQVFEPVQDAILYPAHNQMFFYTWGDTECCLPRGAMEATLSGSFQNLQAGDVLIFEEVIGPQTGNPADADLRHRCAVRLSGVATVDANGKPLVDPLFDQTGKPITTAAQHPAPVTEIRWSQDDALPFPICISSTYLDSEGNKRSASNVSVALGNVLLADHGLSFSGKTLGTVPAPRLFYPPNPAADPCQPTAPTPVPVRFRPTVPDGPLTQAVPQPLAGNPVTPSVVMLGGTSSVNLRDSHGFVCLAVQATRAADWPHLFGVIVQQNQTTPANFDLSVVYGPPGGAAGMPAQVTLESFTNLSLTPTDTNYVVNQLKLSNLIQVSQGYSPPTTPPSGFPAAPTMLPNKGTVSLADLSTPPVTYLTLQATTPTGWPQLFGVLAQEIQPGPSGGNLQELSRDNLQGPSGPIIGNISPSSATAGGPPFTLTVNGKGFVPGSAVEWNGAALATTFVNPTQLMAGVPANLIATTGTVAITVAGAAKVTSGPVSFTIDQPARFGLAVVYCPPSGGVGVTIPVTVEQFANLSLLNLGQVNSNSQLVTVRSFAEAPDPSLSAYDLMHVNPSDALPEIALDGTFEGRTDPWNPKQDLLGSGPSDRVFVVEIESDGTAILRFATPSDPGSELDDSNGLVPDSGTVFVANYRIGNGTAGNVGAESLVYLAAADARIQSCTNPLPASGGTDPETNDQIRRRAPQAFLTQERAVTMGDYEAVAEDNPQVDQAVASLRWTGSWYSVFIAVEPKGGGNLNASLQNSLKTSVERYRLAGQDLKLESPQYVSLQITLQVLVDPSYFQSDVEQSLLQVLGSQLLPNGQKGLFYPDNFTFGQTVYLSPVYAAARSVAGVISVKATRFQPQGVNSRQYLTAGEIKLGSLQVARLDNDPSYPDHGQLILVMRGGK